MPKPGVRGSGRDPPRSPSPPARPLAHRTTSLPDLGGESHDAPQRPAEVRRGPSTRGDIAHPAGSGSTSSGANTAARHSVPKRPTNFRPVPSHPPGPATVGRAQQVRAPPPQPRPSAAKQARPDTQPASAVTSPARPAPSDAVPPRSDAPPARSATRPAASVTSARVGGQAVCSAAPPARPAAR
ncbi:basic proline-rich protein-like [Helicoverpa zea]|uniref:basic proline-rich protein-like n=1 Tax=Helicoverpa zea TaxID=7113 RepID=UPI001F57E6C7|nr:basic proline-rich protein-like [Helicoverpa zea]